MSPNAPRRYQESCSLASPVQKNFHTALLKSTIAHTPQGRSMVSKQCRQRWIQPNSNVPTMFDASRAWKCQVGAALPPDGVVGSNIQYGTGRVGTLDDDSSTGIFGPEITGEFA